MTKVLPVGCLRVTTSNQSTLYVQLAVNYRLGYASPLSLAAITGPFLRPKRQRATPGNDA